MVMKKPPCHILALIIIFLAAGTHESELTVAEGTSPDYVTAILGQSVVLSCSIEFPDGVQVPYIVQWNKQGDKVPIYIWYAGYPPHKGEGYKERITLVNLASINISEIQEADQGWYQCNIIFLNRRPDSSKNGTWVYLEVHAPPHFTTTPQEVYYVKVGDSLVLMCEAAGTPTPSVVWLKDEKPLEPSGNIQLHRGGLEVRMTSLRSADIGDYTCEARNGEGHISYNTKIIIAGGAVITTPPQNVTKLEGSKAEFICVAQALPGNITYKWYRNDVDIVELPWLVSRAIKKNDKMLVIDPLTADDPGKYTCEVTNGIGTPQSASAYLDVEYSARVTYTPTLQYLPLGLSGVIRCHFEANPSFQWVQWSKDKRVFKPLAADGIIHLNNGSMLIKTVTQAHQGFYTCTPYNSHGTDGASGIMEVLVREPPKFVTKPKESYQSTMNGEVKMPCEAQGNPKPDVIWRRADGARLPRERTQIRGGNLTIKFLRKSDYGYYECVVQNEVATLVTSSLLIVESTTPHAPTNLSVNISAYSATVSWLPAYDGGYTQNYVVWHRESNFGDAAWRTIRVTSDDSNSLTIFNLSPNTSYDFRVLSWNKLGESLRSPIVKATTKSADFSSPVYPTDVTGSTYIPTIIKAAATASPSGQPLGYDPAPPQNVTAILDVVGLTVMWSPPTKASADNTYYVVEYRIDSSSSNWSSLSALIRAPNLTYTLSKPVAGKTYFFRIIARTLTASSQPSEVVRLQVPAGLKPSPPRNVSVVTVNEGLRISWTPATEHVMPATFYVLEYKIEDGGWFSIGGPIRSTQYICPMGGKTYFFRLFSKTSSNAISNPTDMVKFVVPTRFKEKAITAGVVGGILFFIVAIILSICAVKICNKRKRRRQERAYSMVACRVTDMRNGGHGPAGSPVPLRKFTESRVSGVNISALRRKVTRFTRLALGLGEGLVGSRCSTDDSSRTTVTSVTNGHLSNSSGSWVVDSRFDYQRRPLFPSSSSERRPEAAERGERASHEESTQRRFPKAVRYQVHVEYSQPAGYISRSPDGRFQVYDERRLEDMYGDEELLEMAPASTRANPSGQQQWGPYRQQQQHLKPWAQTRHLPSSFSLFSDRSWDPDVHTIYSPRDPKFRTSSPGPLAQYRAANFPEEDISSVLLPSSVERSFPTGTQSSGIHSQLSPLSSPPLEPSNRGIFSPNYELPALKILHTHLPNIEEEEAFSDGYRRTLAEDNYDYLPIRRPIPVAWYPNYHQLEVEEEEEEPPPRPPRYTIREPPPRPLEPPPPVPDIKQLEMPRRQLDVYKRIQAQDEESPLATSSPPRLDRRIARVPPSPVSGIQPSPLTMDDQDSPHTYSPVEGLTLVRQHGGGGRYNVTERQTHFNTGPLHHLVANVTIPTPEVTPRAMTLNEGEGDSTMTSDEAFHALGVTASGRMSVASAGTGSSGRGSKPASVSHSRGDSLQGELQEYSPTSRSSSSGFASRNTSQSQSSPHGVGGGGVSRSLPSRPQPSLNVSTDENYEFDSVSPLDLQAAGEQVSGAREENPAAEEGDGEEEGAGAQAKSSKYDDVEIERRIPALKQEFQQFRRRQRERLNDDLMESEC